MQVRIDTCLDRSPRSAPEARELLDVVLPPGPDGAAHDAALVVTELVANAVVHGEGPGIRLVVAAGSGRVRMEVRSGGGVFSAPVGPPPPATCTGRGLVIVDALASAWGVEPTQPGGIRVWAELVMGGGPAGGGRS